jgi:hypothetical protein
VLTESPTSAPGLRDDVDSLLGRLARIHAQRAVLSGVADSLHGAQSSATLARVLDTLERDLALAAREADRLRDRASLS